MPKSKKQPKKPVKSKASKPAAKKIAKPIKKAAKPQKATKPAKPSKVAKPIKVAKLVKAQKPGKATKPEAPKPAKKAVEPVKVAAKEKPSAKVKETPVEVEVEITEVEIEEVEEIVLTDADGRRYCRVKDCDQLATVDGYCRYHYLLYWKKIQVRKKILGEGKLERYIEELTARYPDKFLDMLRKDLRSEKEFLAAIQELEIDESATDGEFEEDQETFIDEVRGISEPGTREEEDF